jgi:acyl-CoA reductase-like NAD-dependent aldehyde dehydrogenase
MTTTIGISETSAVAPRVYGQFIDGAMTEPSGDYIDRHAPGTGRLVARYSNGTVEDIERAIAAARHAFDQGPWPHLSGMERARALLRVAEAMRDNKEHLARIEAEEVGKPIRMARGDVDGSAGLFEFAAAMAMAMHGDVYTTTLGDDFTALVAREPAGVAGLVTPWNFPLLLLAQKLPFAIGAGCTTVAKPASVTAGTTLEMGQLLIEAGIPAGVYNVVTGGGGHVGRILTESHDVDMISFTGSTEVGRSVIEASKGNLKRVSMELGGKSANIVFDDADLEDAVDGVMFGIYFNTGECCVSGSRLLIQESIADTFLDVLVDRVRRLRVGQPLDDDAELGAIVHAEHMEKILEYVDIARQDGFRILTGGDRLTGGVYDGGLFLAPTVIDNVLPTSRVFREEIFGPVLAVTRFRDTDDAIRLANDVEYGLANSVWTKNIDRAIRVARSVRSGTVWVNTTIDGAPQLPGGGVRASGFGREMGQAGFDEFTELKTIQIRTGKRNPFFEG